MHLARCLEFTSLVTHGSTTEGALREIEKVVKEAIAWTREENEEKSPIFYPFIFRYCNEL